MFVLLLLLMSSAYSTSYKALVENLHEDLREDPGSQAHGNSTWNRNLVWPMLIISTLILHPHQYCWTTYTLPTFAGAGHQ
jgi:hypothetical protein